MFNLAFSLIIHEFQPHNRTLNDIDKTWLPHNSEFLNNKEWRAQNFDDNVRTHYAMLLHEDDILTPAGMMKVRGGKGDSATVTIL